MGNIIHVATISPWVDSSNGPIPGQILRFLLRGEISSSLLIGFKTSIQKKGIQLFFLLATDLIGVTFAFARFFFRFAMSGSNFLPLYPLLYFLPFELAWYKSFFCPTVVTCLVLVDFWVEGTFLEEGCFGAFFFFFAIGLPLFLSIRVIKRNPLSSVMKKSGPDLDLVGNNTQSMHILEFYTSSTIVNSKLLDLIVGELCNS